ncbi:ABC1 kinase family protein [Mycolicibacterium sp.]|uniref:ABC1 kinase family protein n=1 Tax=Mycolicibacterium sp. TaxID=2320850 RepID=UPI0037C6DA88
MSGVQHYRRIADTLARHGFGAFIGVAGLQRWVPLHHGLLGHERRGQPYSTPEHLRLALEELGPTYIKLGQVLSTRPDLLPDNYRQELVALQDDAKPVAATQISEVIHCELGGPPSEVFASFELKPLASASLGQAHAATLRDGTEVVVKVRRPHVVEQVAEDLETLRNLAARASRRSDLAADYDLVGIAEEFAHTLRAELDYLQEGRNAERFAANFLNDPTVRVPRIYWETTTSRVLTLERMHGIKVNDVAALDTAGIDRAALASRAARIATQMIFQDGFFHADPHPGNLFVENDGGIALIDFGMVGEVDEQLRDRLGALLLGVIRRDPGAVAAAVSSLSAGRRADVSALRADLSPIIKRYAGADLGQIPIAEATQDVLGVARRHHLVLPRELALLCKTLVMAEGLAEELDPKFQFAEVIAPQAERLIAARYSPEHLARQLRSAGADALEFLADVPDRLTELRQAVQAGPDLHLRAEELEPLISRLEATGRRLALAVILAAAIRSLADLRWLRRAMSIPRKAGRE